MTSLMEGGDKSSLYGVSEHCRVSGGIYEAFESQSAIGVTCDCVVMGGGVKSPDVCLSGVPKRASFETHASARPIGKSAVPH